MCRYSRISLIGFHKPRFPWHTYEVILMLECLEHELQNLQNDFYRISIIMCPSKKLVWFHQNPDWRDELEDRVEARKVIINRWTESYARPEATPSSAPVAMNTATGSDSTTNAELA
ncbi:hypothetical protein HD554DRAFT_971223 [Boletus coccyginus]|nr:hypothetical protein HD554DRAFT_971223 [Boletus coccyginus]